jgi:hypothetical protein
LTWQVIGQLSTACCLYGIWGALKNNNPHLRQRGRAASSKQRRLRRAHRLRTTGTATRRGRSAPHPEPADTVTQCGSWRDRLAGLSAELDVIERVGRATDARSANTASREVGGAHGAMRNAPGRVAPP